MHFRYSAVALAAAALPWSAASAADATAAAVVVTATRQEQRVDEVLSSVEVIEREEIERAGHSTLAELLAGRQGLQVASTGGPGSKQSVFIRGANSEHTLLLIDGMRVGSATNGAPTLELVPLALIDRIEILRGPASALYGSDAIGGVIQIFTRKGDKGVRPSLRIGIGSDGTRALDAGLAGSSERLRYGLSAGYEQTRGFDAMPDQDAGGDADRDGFRNRYLSAAVSLGFRDDDEVGVALFHSGGRNWYDGNNNYDSYIDKRVDNAMLHLRNRLGAGWVSTLRYGHSKDVSHTRSTAAAPSEFDTVQRQFGWQHDVELAGGSLLAAYERLEQEVESTGPFDETERSINSYLLGWGGRFDSHSVQVNARHDRNSQFGSKTTGSAAYGYQISREWRVHGSIGTAFRAPTFNDLYFPLSCFPPWGCFGGNPDLKPEEALNRELGVAWETSEFTLSATYFNNRVKNLIIWGNVPENVGIARIEGVELGLTTEVLGFNVRASYDYLDATDKDSGEELRRRARHGGALAIDRASGRWSYGLEWVAQGRRFDGMPNDASNRMGGYGLTNLFVHYAFAPDWRVELRANNVFDKKYELAQGFDTPSANAFLALRYAPR